MKKLIDVLFVVDVTGSMGGFIADAKNRMRDILKSVAEDYDLDLKVAFSFYRDHPTQEPSFVTVSFDLMSPDKAQEIIDEVTVDGGGDQPEAVLDGIVDGVKGTSWREGSTRTAFLIGDACAHGMVWEEPCCQCGLTWGDAVAAMEENGVVLYAVAIGGLEATMETFGMLATFSGGMLVSADNAMDAILATLKEKSEEIDLGSKVLEMLSKDTSVEDICKILNIDREKVSELETKATVST